MGRLRVNDPNMPEKKQRREQNQVLALESRTVEGNINTLFKKVFDIEDNIRDKKSRALGPANTVSRHIQDLSTQPTP